MAITFTLNELSNLSLTLGIQIGNIKTHLRAEKDYGIRLDVEASIEAKEALKRKIQAEITLLQQKV